MIGTSIHLTEVERGMCRYVAKARYENNRAAGVKNARIGDQCDWQTDLEGIAAEVAFCKLFNVYPDLSISPRSASRGEDRFDCVVLGKTVDVKSTVYSTGRLLAVPWKGEGNPPDYYALMVGRFPEYTFRGVMKGDELLQKTRLGNLGHGPTYIANQSELIEFP